MATPFEIRRMCKWMLLYQQLSCYIILFFFNVGRVDYKSEIAENDITEVSALCQPPLDRGCDEADRELLDAMVTNIHGQMDTPLSMEEARDLYIELKSFF